MRAPSHLVNLADSVNSERKKKKKKNYRLWCALYVGPFKGFAVKEAAPAMHNKTVHASASLRANLLRRFVHGKRWVAIKPATQRGGGQARQLIAYGAQLTVPRHWLPRTCVRSTQQRGPAAALGETKITTTVAICFWTVLYRIRSEQLEDLNNG